MRIVTDGHPALSRVCRPFDFNHPPVDPVRLEVDMRRAMTQMRGVGLAAPQVDLDLRVLVMSSMGVGFFNPEILETGGDRTYAEEGCLSFPGLKTMVLRWLRVRVTFQDQTGRPQLVELKDFAARVFQHELDHLNGRTLRQSGNSVALALAMKRKGRR